MLMVRFFWPLLRVPAPADLTRAHATVLFSINLVNNVLEKVYPDQADEFTISAITSSVVVVRLPLASCVRHGRIHPPTIAPPAGHAHRAAAVRNGRRPARQEAHVRDHHGAGHRGHLGQFTPLLECVDHLRVLLPRYRAPPSEDTVRHVLYLPRRHHVVIGRAGVWRLILGVGLGGEYPLTAIITSEFFENDANRGARIAGVFSLQVRDALATGSFSTHSPRASFATRDGASWWHR